MLIHVISALRKRTNPTRGVLRAATRQQGRCLLRLRLEVVWRPGKAVTERLLLLQRPAQKCQLGPRKGKSSGRTMARASEAKSRLTIYFCTGETITSLFWALVGDLSRSGGRVSQLTISAILGGVGKSCLTGKVRHPLDGPLVELTVC